jgi:hypothetical protein
MFTRPTVLCMTSHFIIRLYVHLLLHSSYAVQRRNKVKEKGLLVRHAITAFTFVSVSFPGRHGAVQIMAPWLTGSHCAPCERVRSARTGYRLTAIINPSSMPCFVQIIAGVSRLFFLLNHVAM